MFSCSQRQLWVLFLLATISTIGVSLPYPIFAPMLLHPTSGSLIVPSSWPTSSHAIVLGILLAIYPLGMFFGSPVLGSLSDYYGRRKLITLSLLAATLGYLLTAVAVHYHQLFLLLLTRFLTGFCESNVAILRSAVADMPDINKHQGFGLVGTGLTVGYIIGPPISGLLIGSGNSGFSFAVPFYAAAVMVLSSAILSWLTLSDSVNAGLKQFGDYSQQLRLVMRRFNIMKQLRYLCFDQKLKFLFLAGFCFFMAVDTYYEFYPAYLIGQWQMSSLGIALITAIMSSGIAFGNSFLSRFYAERYAIMPTLLLHMLLYAVMLIIILLVKNVMLLYAVFGVTGIFISICSNHFYVEVSETASDKLQGEALGMATGLRMLGDACTSVIGGFLILLSIKLPLLIAIMGALLAAWLVFTKLISR